MLLDWLISEYYVGPTSVGNPLISGLFIDDYWCDATGPCPLRSGRRALGPAETEAHVVQDLGMTDTEINTMAAKWRENMDAVYDAILARNATTW
eukprot:COSAG05_NODE_61_length_23137_cov_22.080693_3_plen_94_part_00